MNHLVITLLAVVLTAACHRKAPVAASVDTKDTSSALLNSSSSEKIPECIQNKIDSLKSIPILNPPAEVDEYDYKGEKVYGFSSGCCDMFYMVYKSECDYLCAPSGGFTGKGDGKCADFNTSAKKLRTLWKDERGK